jgi:hypothetical protein
LVFNAGSRTLGKHRIMRVYCGRFDLLLERLGWFFGQLLQRTGRRVFHPAADVDPVSNGTAMHAELGGEISGFPCRSLLSA